MDVVKARGKNGKAGSADVALSYINRLYRLEREYKKKEYSPEEIRQARQEQATPILAEFRTWLDKKVPHTPPKGLLGKAMNYALNQWDRLIVYVEDGRLAPDNNMAENCIRPFVIGRKNWLFSGTPEGAEASALLYSLIETAKANKLEPYAYLRYIFEKLPFASTVAEYEKLLPWNVKGEESGEIPALTQQFPF
jgi:transposase